ncbi:ergothioneine biosynthesis protein EgtB [Pedobacter miscanthi]|uniref:Ergothioneine biosynthesis protein EgtB n=1 Tax=Pedobacter miscanthi TaxID=2259170 RepID=A0A366L249_9SPHI|nr:ergothioneine biosynthesis protein EgtB [Pedobacter miscanthi]RBQ07860.1 ergothioneine biosynthesis protein EgtB [Pedobacter miscanthi]
MSNFNIDREDLIDLYKRIRRSSIEICRPLQTEDYVVQPADQVSPPKWHLGHTTWFFETFILKQFVKGYREFDPNYNYVFNSYYESVGTRVLRTDRGNLSRPTAGDVMRYRVNVDSDMFEFLNGEMEEHVKELIILGLNHEEQHQELLMSDIKYILGHNPLFPPYLKDYRSPRIATDRNEKYLHYQNGNNEAYKYRSTGEFKTENEFLNKNIKKQEGIYEIGATGVGFHWDNEMGRHKVYLEEYSIAPRLVTNGEYLQFMADGGYKDFRYWHAQGWEWVNKENISSPLYWHMMDNGWNTYTFRGIEKLDLNEAVAHVSYFEAYAYAQYAGKRLPTEFEWEAASEQFHWGLRWEWTESAYLPYPRFKKAAGAIGEYNGKFMVGQQVLRGGSEVTPPGHSRKTYRNFFQPEQRWQFTGIRLVEN